MEKPIVLEKAQAIRMRDRAGGAQRNIGDAIRAWWLSLDSRVQIGRNVSIKPNVEFRLTDNARLEIGDDCTFDSFAYVQLTKPEPTVILGRSVGIGRHNVIAAKCRIEIGDFTQLGPYCQINDQGHGTDRSDLIMNQHAILAPVKIGRDCWLGSGVRVLKGVTIGDGAIIGAGSVVTHDIPEYEIWAGVPARKIRDR